MSTQQERNKQAVRDFFRLFEEGRVDDAFAMTTPDFEWWGGAGDTAEGLTMTASELAPIEKGFMKYFVGPMTITLDPITAEDDRVVAEMKTFVKLTNGRDYANCYSQHFVFRDGMIFRWREYYNPKVVEAAIGDLLRADGNPTV